jgi:hypothetical protein
LWKLQATESDPFSIVSSFFSSIAYMSTVESHEDQVNLPTGPIGVFDSGVGGLSVLRSIRKEIPLEAVIYLADQIHIPYGPRPLVEVRSFAFEITRFLLDLGCKLIVVACNAASAAALHLLRQRFPQVAHWNGTGRQTGC